MRSPAWRSRGAAVFAGLVLLAAATGCLPYPTSALLSGSSKATVRGQIFSTAGAVAGANVWILTPDGILVTAAVTDEDGTYVVVADPGSYRVFAHDASGAHTDVFWPDQPDLRDATVLNLAAGETQTVDVQMWTVAEQPVPSYTGNPRAPRTAVIGDSITQQSTFAIHQALDPGNALSVRGLNEQTIGDMLPVAAKFASTRPRRFVIALGTNDAIHAIPLTQSEADLEAMVAEFWTSDCVEVLTVNDHTASTIINDRAAELNRFIRTLLADTGVHVIDWQRVVADHADAPGPKSAWFSDGVHLTYEGQDAFASTIAAGLSTCMPAEAN